MLNLFSIQIILCMINCLIIAKFNVFFFFIILNMSIKVVNSFFKVYCCNDQYFVIYEDLVYILNLFPKHQFIIILILIYPLLLKFTSQFIFCKNLSPFI